MDRQKLTFYWLPWFIFLTLLLCAVALHEADVVGTMEVDIAGFL